MAENAASPTTGITRRELEALLTSLGEAERELFRDLVREGEPQESVRLVEIMHHLQARLSE
jgi:hypothetical protein